MDNIDRGTFVFTTQLVKEELPKKKLELVVNRAKTNIRGWDKKARSR